ncbi:MAG: helix-turn-helix transcriptional regulator [Tagaea sp.]|nr:helix-turn-helix transcriptional regulator [Tagaea sp.]
MLRSESEILVSVRDWRARRSENLADSARHTFYLTLAGGTEFTRVIADGERPYEGRDREGDVTFIPAGRPRWGIYERADTRFLSVRIDPRYFARLSPRLQSTYRPVTNARWAALAAVLAPLSRSGAAPADPLASDAVVAALAGAVAPASEPFAPAPERSLAARVEEFAEANLGREFGISAMAEAAGLSPWQLNRALRAAIGISPYRLVTNVRIRRAKTLLAERRLSIAEVALACGFYDHAHFTRTFGRYCGTTPAAYRAGL